MSNPTLEEKVDQLVTDVAEIKIAIAGYKGNPGLAQRHEDLAKDYYSFKRRCLAIFFLLLGSGGLGLGIVKAIEMVK